MSSFVADFAFGLFGAEGGIQRFDVGHVTR